MRPIEDWSVAIQPIRPVDAWPRLLRVARQTVHCADGYSNSGRERRGAVHVLLKCSLAGCGELVYDGVSQAVPAGWAFLTWIADPKLIYRYPAAAQEPWHFIFAAFTCDPAAIDGLMARHGRLFPTPIDGPLVQRLQAFRRPGGGQVDMDAAAGAVLVAEILGDLARAADHAALATVGPALRRVHAARQLIAASGLRPPTVAALAAELGISRELLGRSFRAVLGRSPQAYLAAWHMEQAAQLLARRELSVSAIAERLGFDTPSHFARAFRRRFGMSPSEYQRGGMAVAGEISIGSSAATSVKAGKVR